MPRTADRPTQRRFRFTDAAIRRLPAHDRDSPSREMEYSDTEVVGLRVLVSKNGRKFFHLRYRFGGRKRVSRIGEYPATSLADARQRALEYKGILDRGEDPRALQEADKAAAYTFAQFAQEEYLPHAMETKKSWKDDRNKIVNEMMPVFGDVAMIDLDARTLQAYLTSVKQKASGPTANRHRALLSKMFNLAVLWGRIERSPLAQVEKFRESANRERYLDDAEMRSFLTALDTYPDQLWADCVRLLLFTGMRRAEALDLTWDRVDLDSGVVTLRETKSGKGRAVVLTQRARQVLGRLHADADKPNTGDVFPKDAGCQKVRSVKLAFDHARDAANISNLRLHDLRHTFASMALNEGVPLEVVRKMLGHSSQAKTECYAHPPQRRHQRPRRRGQGGRSREPGHGRVRTPSAGRPSLS